ncbi:hypothetical protein BH23VER1_BH23VER1_14250 [soil metagenome]
MTSHLILRALSLALIVVQLLVYCPLAAAETPLPAGVRVIRDLAYMSDGHARQKLDLYLPAVGSGPLIVFIHGGAWRSGSKDGVDSAGMLAHGYAVASVGYRLSQHARFPAQIEDCKSAIRWLRAHAGEYGYDPERIAAWGTSAGGHLTALLATTGTTREFDVGEHLDQSSAIRCGVDFFGPTDFPGWAPASDMPVIQRSGPESCLVQLFGGPVGENLGIARQASPIAWVGRDSAPLFIMHGTDDPLVGLEQSQKFADKLEEAGVDVSLEVIEGGGHGGAEFFAGDRPDLLLAFLSRHLEIAGGDDGKPR